MTTFRCLCMQNLFIITLFLANLFCIDTAQAQLQKKLAQTKEKLTQLKDNLGSLKKSLTTLKSELSPKKKDSTKEDKPEISKAGTLNPNDLINWQTYIWHGDLDNVNHIIKKVGPKNLQALLSWDKNEYGDATGEPAIHLVARGAREYILKAFIDAAKKFDKENPGSKLLEWLILMRDKKNNTALILAHFEPMLDTLLNAAEETGKTLELIYAQDQKKWTALMQASTRSQVGFLQKIIAATRKAGGEDAVLKLLKMQNDKGETALHIAGRRAIIVSALLKAAGEKADIFKAITNNKTETALDIAKQNSTNPDWKETIDLLSSSIQMPTVTTWLEYAQYGNTQEIKKLIDATKDNPTDRWNLISLKNSDDMNALHWAAAEGKEAVVTMLIEAIEFDPEKKKNLLFSRDNDGVTALIYAAESGHKNIVQKLLNEAGTKAKELAKISVDGKTAEQIAKESNHTETANLLKKYADTSTSTLLSDEQEKWFKAIENGNLDIVNKFIEGAKKISQDALWNLLSQRNKFDTPVLELVVQYYNEFGQHKNIAQAILDAAGPRAWELVSMTRSGRSPLGYAIAVMRNFELTEMFVNVNKTKAKELIKTEDFFGKTILNEAKENQDRQGKIYPLLQKLP